MFELWRSSIGEKNESTLQVKSPDRKLRCSAPHPLGGRWRAGRFVTPLPYPCSNLWRSDQEVFPTTAPGSWHSCIQLNSTGNGLKPTLSSFLPVLGPEFVVSTCQCWCDPASRQRSQLLASKPRLRLGSRSKFPNWWHAHPANGYPFQLVTKEFHHCWVNLQARYQKRGPKW